MKTLQKKTDIEQAPVEAGLQVWLRAALVCALTLPAADIAIGREHEPSVSVLIEPDQLLRKLDDKNLRLLDVRAQREYAKAHVPGAIRVDVGDWRQMAAADGGLRDAKGWAERVGPLGIRKETRVVVYGSSLSNTARIWWFLKYVGVEKVSILDGGWEWWIRDERPTESIAPSIAPAHFKPDFQVERLTDMDSSKQLLGGLGVKFVDTRSTQEFGGGRIPGAVHLEWKELVAEDGRFKSKTQLQQLFRGRGIVPSETAVCY